MKHFTIEKMLEYSPYRRKRAMLFYIKKKVMLERRAGGSVYFKVEGNTLHDVIYSKRKKEWSCDCKHFTLKQTPCSHILAANILLLRPGKKEVKKIIGDG